MNKIQIVEQLKRIGKEVSTYTVERVENNDKIFAIEGIKDTIHDLNILIHEITKV